MGFLDEFGLKKVIQILRTKFSEIDHVHLGSDLRSAVPIERGGTGAEDAFTARLNLGAQAAITGGASSILTTNLTASRVLISNSSGKVAVSDVTSTELGYLDGVTSNIQTQLDAKIEELPVASASQAGIVSTDTQTFAGQKTFNNRIIANASSTGDGTSGSIVAQSGNPAIVSYNSASNKYIELIAGSSGNRGLYTGDGWVLYLGGDGKLHFGQPVNATNLPVASATEAGIVSTGAQAFAGEKSFLGRTVMGGSIRYPGFSFTSTNGSSFAQNRVGLEYIDTGNGTFGTVGSVRWGVDVYGNDGNNGVSSKYETYRLPAVDSGRTGNATYDILTSKSAVTIAQGGTGQTGQTAQQSYTPTVKIGTTTPTVSSLSAYYKSWGLMKLIGGRFNLTTTGTGSLIISLPTGFTVPTSSVQPMGILIAPDQKVYHIRVAADGLTAMSNGGSNVAWTAGYYCFWAVVMGN